MFGLDPSQFQSFIEKTAATAIANQAVLTCHARGVPLTVDNAILFVGDHFDPTNPAFSGVIDHLYDALISIVGESMFGLPTIDRVFDRKTSLPC